MKEHKSTGTQLRGIHFEHAKLDGEVHQLWEKARKTAEELDAEVSQSAFAFSSGPSILSGTSVR